MDAFDMIICVQISKLYLVILRLVPTVECHEVFGKTGLQPDLSLCWDIR
jgi:hypothetical protein